MAAVSKNSRDGRWLARWRDPTERQRRSAARSTPSADSTNCRPSYTVPGTSIRPQARRDQRVRTSLGSWPDAPEGLDRCTLSRHRGDPHPAHLEYLGPEATSATPTQAWSAQAWIADLSRRGLKPGTIRQTHRVFSLILGAAVQDGRQSVAVPGPGERVVYVADEEGSEPPPGLMASLPGQRVRLGSTMKTTVPPPRRPGGSRVSPSTPSTGGAPSSGNPTTGNRSPWT